MRKDAGKRRIGGGEDWAVRDAGVGRGSITYRNDGEDTANVLDIRNVGTDQFRSVARVTPMARASVVPGGRGSSR